MNLLCPLICFGSAFPIQTTLSRLSDNLLSRLKFIQTVTRKRMVMKMKSSAFSTIVKIMSFTLILVIWKTLIDQQFDPVIDLIIILGGVITVVPISMFGRLILNKNPIVERVFWVNLFVHFSIMICLGASIIRAILTNVHWRGISIPFPRVISLLFLIICGGFVTITIFYLALRGLGAPFALIISSKYLVSDWLYTRLRNPMVLAIILFLESLGLFFQSAWFIIWVSFLVFPVWTFFLVCYEEKELEIRFGESYLVYKARTPIFLPFKGNFERLR